MALKVAKVNTAHSLYDIICYGLMFEQCNLTDIPVYGFNWNGIADELTPFFFIIPCITVPHSCLFEYKFLKIVHMPMCTEMFCKELYISSQ